MTRLAALLLATAACTGSNPDYLTPCTVGVRSCVDYRPTACVPLSAVSVDAGGGADGGGASADAAVARTDAGVLGFLHFERCPGQAVCSAGLCIAPTDAPTCTTDHDCVGTNKVCTPLLDPTGKQAAKFCLATDGIAPGAAACASDNACRSDLCLQTTSKTTPAVCFLACKADADCPSPDTCRDFTVVLSGIMATVKGCSPP